MSPRGGSASGNGPSSDPPARDQAAGTRPLKRLPDPAGPSEPTPTEGLPPATVLQDVSPARDPRTTSETEETHRVRLVPRLPNPRPWRLILQVDGPGQTRIGLDVRQALTLGRLDPAGENNPDLDLTPYLASEHGVSRQHSVLIPTVEALYLGDLDSANGTWINGTYLEPGERYALAAGDKVELGLLKLVVVTVSAITR